METSRPRSAGGDGGGVHASEKYQHHFTEAATVEVLNDMLKHMDDFLRSDGNDRKRRLEELEERQMELQRLCEAALQQEETVGQRLGMSMSIQSSDAGDSGDRGPREDSPPRTPVRSKPQSAYWAIPDIRTATSTDSATMDRVVAPSEDSDSRERDPPRRQDATRFARPEKDEEDATGYMMTPRSTNSFNSGSAARSSGVPEFATPASTNNRMYTSSTTAQQLGGLPHASSYRSNYRAPPPFGEQGNDRQTRTVNRHIPPPTPSLPRADHDPEYISDPVSRNHYHEAGLGPQSYYSSNTYGSTTTATRQPQRTARDAPFEQSAASQYNPKTRIPISSPISAVGTHTSQTHGPALPMHTPLPRDLTVDAQLPQRHPPPPSPPRRPVSPVPLAIAPPKAIIAPQRSPLQQPYAEMATAASYDAQDPGQEEEISALVPTGNLVDGASTAVALVVAEAKPHPYEISSAAKNSDIASRPNSMLVPSSHPLAALLHVKQNGLHRAVKSAVRSSRLITRQDRSKVADDDDVFDEDDALHNYSQADTTGTAKHKSHETSKKQKGHKKEKEQHQHKEDRGRRGTSAESVTSENNWDRNSEHPHKARSRGGSTSISNAESSAHVNSQKHHLNALTLLQNENDDLHVALANQRNVNGEQMRKVELLARHLVNALKERNAVMEHNEQREAEYRVTVAEVAELRGQLPDNEEAYAMAARCEVALASKEEELRLCHEEMTHLASLVRVGGRDYDTVPNDAEEPSGERSKGATADASSLSVLLKSFSDRLAEAKRDTIAARQAQRASEERARQLMREVEQSTEHIQTLDYALSKLETRFSETKLSRMFDLHFNAAAPAGGATPAAESPKPGEDLSLVWDADAYFSQNPSPSLAGEHGENQVDCSSFPLEAKKMIARLSAANEHLSLRLAESTRQFQLQLSNVQRDNSDLRRTLQHRDHLLASSEGERIHEENRRNTEKLSSWRLRQQLKDVQGDAVLVSQVIQTSRHSSGEVVDFLDELKKTMEERAILAHTSRNTTRGAMEGNEISNGFTTSEEQLHGVQKTLFFVRQVVRDFELLSRLLFALRNMDIHDVSSAESGVATTGPQKSQFEIPPPIPPALPLPRQPGMKPVSTSNFVPNEDDGKHAAQNPRSSASVMSSSGVGPIAPISSSTAVRLAFTPYATDDDGSCMSPSAYQSDADRAIVAPHSAVPKTTANAGGKARSRPPASLPVPSWDS